MITAQWLLLFEWTVGVGKGLILAAPRRQQVYYD